MSATPGTLTTWCQARGFELHLIEPEELPAALTEQVAVLMLTHVNYRSGAMHDMAALTACAHAAGVLTVWDLAHSAGAVPVALKADDADFSIGCGYKYLNGGPGAPAFVWVHPRHTVRVQPRLPPDYHPTTTRLPPGARCWKRRNGGCKLSPKNRL